MPMKIGMTLDIKDGKLAEYKEQHDRIWPEIKSALQSVGLINLSIWAWGSRLFYYGEYAGKEPFQQAMDRYSKMPRVQEWEALMHNYQQQLPGSTGDVWWQPCDCLYSSDF